MTLLLQRPGVLTILLCFRQIRKARRILFFRYRDLSGVPERPLPRRITRLTRWMNPNVGVGEIPEEQYLRLWQQNNRESDRCMEELWEKVRTAHSVRLMRRLIGALEVDRYYKIRLLPYLLTQTLFYRMAQALSREDAVVLVPAQWDRYQLHRFFLPTRAFRETLPKGVALSLRVREALVRGLNGIAAGNLLRLFLFPLEPILGRILSGRVARKTLPVRAEVLIPLISGIHPDGVVPTAGHDDRFLLGSELDASRVAFYFSDGRFQEQEKSTQIQRLKQEGLRYVDPADFRVDLRFLKQAAYLLGKLLRGALHPRLLAEDPRVATVSAQLGRHFLREWHFASCVESKVLLEFEDYAPAHVVRTLIASRLGRLTLGMHHGNPAAPLILPGQRYLHMGRLLVWGKSFARAHSPYWNCLRQLPLGAYRSDFILQAKDSPRWERIRIHYETRFGGVRPLILLLFPSMEWYILRSRIQEELEGLRLLRSLLQGFRILCRFRSAEWRQRWLQAGLREIMEADSRIREADGPLTTYEWMALSDLVIAYGHSTAVIEAAVAGKPCVSFDHMLSGEAVFGPYGHDLVLMDRIGLKRTVQRFLEGTWNGSKGMKALAEDFSYFSDGRCVQRFRSAIREAIQEGEPSRLPPSKPPLELQEAALSR